MKPLTVQPGEVPRELESEYMPTVEAASALGVSLQRVDYLIANGRIHPIAKRGRNRFVLRAQVERIRAARAEGAV